MLPHLTNSLMFVQIGFALFLHSVVSSLLSSYPRWANRAMRCVRELDSRATRHRINLHGHWNPRIRDSQVWLLVYIPATIMQISRRHPGAMSDKASAAQAFYCECARWTWKLTKKGQCQRVCTIANNKEVSNEEERRVFSHESRIARQIRIF